MNKILILYTPRSKSTMVHRILAKKFGLESLVDPLTYSKLKHKNYSEFNNIINYINNANNICVKISSTCFWDSRTSKIVDYYKTIDYNSFDEIIFITRDDKIAATLSYGYMDHQDDTTWHKRKGQVKEHKQYFVPKERVIHLMMAYITYQKVKDYVCSEVKNTRFYEFETVVEEISKDFCLSATDLDIDLVENGIDYESLVTNYNEVALLINTVYNDKIFLNES